MADKLYRIERPIGATYALEGYAVYAYDTYPKGSVLEGQTRRAFISRHDTLREAVLACPVLPEIEEGL